MTVAARRRRLAGTRTAGARPAIDRAGGNDLLQLSYQARPAEAQVGAVLILDPPEPPELESVRRALRERVRAVPRLRQRLMATPPGCGRPVWVDDPGFDVAAHVGQTSCPGPGDLRALLDLAASVVTAALPAGRPRWSVTLVRDLAGDRTGVIVSFHHVLADGIGGLAVLSHLVDHDADRAVGGDASPCPDRFPRPAPPRGMLAADAVRTRLRDLRRAPRLLPLVLAALGQLRVGLLTPAPRISLNRPTGTRRRLGVARADLAAVRAAAHAQGGTVNDVVLAAVTGALHTFLLNRDERQDRFMVGVSVSGHPAGEADPVRNQAGVVPVLLPGGGSPRDRLRQVIDRTRAVKAGARGATAVLMQPVFAFLARFRTVRWYISRQRRVNVFATNLRGPSRRLTFLGAPVSDLLAVNAVAGNVSVAFGTLSYAGTLAVTVVADPEICPDADGLAADLQRHLDEYTNPPPA
jgi:WS/DGAT/MGAT family acyltransferase